MQITSQNVHSQSGIDSNSNIQSSSQSGGNPIYNGNDTASLENEFLTLMVAQIQNQDPLNPADGTEYVAQLAQFTQVESTENMVKLMQNQVVQMDNLQVLTTGALVGESVSVRTDKLIADDDSVIKGTIELESATNVVTIELTNAYGEVTKINLPSSGKGNLNFEIDTDDLDLEGAYEIKVVVDEGQNYNPAVTINGEVNSVSIPSDGGASIVEVVGVGEVPFYNISKFG